MVCELIEFFWFPSLSLPSAAAELQAEDRGPVEAVQGAGGDRGGEQAPGQTATRASAGRVVPGAG